jgi:uncharacterized delta-60 repeat protein
MSLQTTASRTTPSTSWARKYGRGVDHARSVEQTSDGGYIVAGDTFYGGYLPWVLKLNSTGAVTWQKAYESGVSTSSFASDVEETSDGGYVVAGYEYIPRTWITRAYVLVLKLNPTGSVEWQKTYKCSRFDCAYSIQQTVDGGYVVAGYTSSFGAGQYDAWVLKLNSTGGVTWQKTYGGTSDDKTYSIQQTVDGGYVVAGYTNSSVEGPHDFWVLKLNSTGGVTWQKTYGRAGDNEAYSVRQTYDGGYIVAGTTDLGELWYGNFWVLKLDSSGSVKFNRDSGARIGSTSVIPSESNATVSEISASLLGDTATVQDTQATPWNTNAGTTAQTGPDTIPPGTIGDLSADNVTEHSITLTWTAPGDDYYWGNATGYVVRYSTSGPITDANWESATDYTQSWTPQPQGETETHVVSGFMSDTMYWFAVKAYDEVPNYGNVSNSPHETTAESPNLAFTYWAKTYGGAGDDVPYSVRETSDGGYILAGDTTSYGAGGSDVWVLKLTSTGSVEWQKTYGGSRDDMAQSVEQTVDGGYIVAGRTDSFGAGRYDVWVLKLDSTGGVRWQKTYGGSYDDSARSIQQTSDGGYIVAGLTQYAPDIQYAPNEWLMGNSWVLKLDSTGRIIWQKTYGGGEAYSVQQTRDGGYIVGGNSWVLKLDSNGSVQWQKTYGEEYYQFLWVSVQVTSDGGCIVVEDRHYRFMQHGASLCVLKFDSSGSLEWQKGYESNLYTWAGSVQETSDGGYVVAGSVYGGFGSDSDFLLLKLNSSGSVDWGRVYGGGAGEDAHSIQQTSDGRYIVAGSTESFGAGGPDFWVLKLDSHGLVVWNEASGASTQTAGVDCWNSSAWVNATSVTPVDSAGTVQDTQVTPLDTNATIMVQAYYSMFPTATELVTTGAALTLGFVLMAVVAAVDAMVRSRAAKGRVLRLRIMRASPHSARVKQT